MKDLHRVLTVWVLLALPYLSMINCLDVDLGSPPATDTESREVEATSCPQYTCKAECGEMTTHWDPNLTPAFPSFNRRRRSADKKGECKCDIHCEAFGDCCEDYYTTCRFIDYNFLFDGVLTLEDAKFKILQLYDLGSEPQMAMFLYKSCLKIRQPGEQLMYWMISDCPDDGADPDISRKCRDPPITPLGLTPSYLTASPVFVFRNVYCGVCNGFDQDEQQLWSSNIKCTSLSDTSQLSYSDVLTWMREGKCYIISIPPEGARTCTQNQRESLESCPMLQDMYTGMIRPNSLQCRLYWNPIHGDFGEKSNIHCGACSAGIARADLEFQCSGKEGHLIIYEAMVPICESTSCASRCQNFSYEKFAKCQCDVECFLFGDCCYDFTSVCLNDFATLLEINSNRTLLLDLIDEMDINMTWAVPHGVELVVVLKKETDREDAVEAVRTRGTEIDDVDPDGEGTEIPEYEHFMLQTLQASSELFKNMSLLYHSYRSCLLFPGLSYGVWAISGCPEMNRDTRCSSSENEMDLTLFTPASHKDHQGLVFRNIYCGICNGVPLDELRQWNSVIYCTRPVTVFTSIDELLSDGLCELTASEIEGGRLCSPEDAKAPPGTGLCNLYTYPVASSGFTMRNPHCSKSLEVEYACVINKNNADLNGPGRLPQDDDYQQSEAKGGLGILFNFNQDGLNMITEDGQAMSPMCETDEVYDYFNDKCKMLICQPGTVAVKGVCVSNGTWYAEERNMIFPNGSGFLMLSVFIATEVPLLSEHITNSLSRIDDIPESTLRTMRVDDVSRMPDYLSEEARVGWNETIQKISLAARTEKFNVLMDLASSVVTSLPSILSKDQTVLVSVVQNFPTEERLECSFGAVIGLEDTSMETLKGIPYANSSGDLYPLENIAFVLSIGSDREIHKAYACQMPLDCDPVMFNVTDFEMVDGSLESLNSDLVLRNGTYFVSGDNVYSCHNFTQSAPKRFAQFFKFDEVQDILTYATFGVSIISLLATLVVYIILPQLRNFPGRLTMSLSISLILAQALLLMLRLPRPGLLCKVLAVTLHFSWLVTFMWMTGMSTNLASTFIRKTQVSQTDCSIVTRHVKYSVLVIGVPFVLVAATAAVDFMDVPFFDIGYGSHGVCWIGNPRASLLVFGVPIGVVVLVNLVAYVLTFINIERGLRMTKNMSSTRGDRNKAVIYWKLFIIMGLTWSFCFTAAFANTPVLWYIFILLNGLQGFYIFLAFVCTDRVLKLLRKKFTGQESEETKTSQSTTMSKI